MARTRSTKLDIDQLDLAALSLSDLNRLRDKILQETITKLKALAEHYRGEIGKTFVVIWAPDGGGYAATIKGISEKTGLIHVEWYYDFEDFPKDAYVSADCIGNRWEPTHRKGVLKQEERHERRS